MTELENLRDQLRIFAAERGWHEFHSPKNLSMALSVEAAELLEHFQWLTESQSMQLPPAAREAVSHELADVLIYLLELCDVMGIDPIAAAMTKMVLNAQKHPVAK